MRESERGERCGQDNCRSRQYYLEDGQWFCSNGHVKEARLEVEIDYDGVSQSQRIKTKSVASEQTTDASDSGGEAFTGKEGYELYLQAYQLIMRHQLYWLVHKRGFPAKLQDVVRDIWLIKLNSLGSSRDTGYMSSAEASQTSDSQMSEVSTQSSYSTGSQVRRRQRKRRRRTNKFETPKLIWTISAIYLGMILMRLPVPLKDLHDWMQSLDLPYLNAFRVLPENMRKRLHYKYMRTLQPNVESKSFMRKTIPDIYKLYRTIHYTFRAYQRDPGIELPPFNHVPLLYRFVKELGLPGEMYLSVTNLIELLSYKFTMISAENVSKRITDNPDVALMSLTVIAAKTWYGFDNLKRHPRNAEDISATLPDWDAWKAHLEDLGKDEKSPKRVKHWELNLDERELYDMSNDDLDLYMDWYEKAYYSAEGGTGKGKAPRQILRFFEDESSPMVVGNQEGERSHEISEEFLRLCNLNTNNLTHVEVIPEDDANILRSGHGYIMFNPDRHQDLPPKMSVFLKAAAVCIGLPFKLFLRELYHMECRCLAKERQLRKEAKSKGKAARRGDDDNDNDDDGEQLEAQAGYDAMQVDDHETEGNDAAENRNPGDQQVQIDDVMSRMSDADINANDR